MRRMSVLVLGLGVACAGGCSVTLSGSSTASTAGPRRVSLIAGDGVGRAIFSETRAIAWAPDQPWNAVEPAPRQPGRGFYAQQPPARDPRTPSFYRTATVPPTSGADDR